MVLLKHVALTMDSKSHAMDFYEKLLDAELVKEFQVSNKLVMQIFGVDVSEDEISVLVFEIENNQFEIFITGEKRINRFDHVCIAVENLNDFVKQCNELDIIVSLITKGEKELVFIQDFVGNHFEIKEK